MVQSDRDRWYSSGRRNFCLAGVSSTQETYEMYERPDIFCSGFTTMATDMS